MAIILGGPNRDEKGGMLHKVPGRMWVAQDPVYSFFVVFLSLDQGVGNYGPFHSLCVLAIFCTGPGAYFAWSGNIERHKLAMLSLWRCLGYRRFLHASARPGDALGQIMNQVLFS